jgi:hypothetical protein
MLTFFPAALSAWRRRDAEVIPRENSFYFLSKMRKHTFLDNVAQRRLGMSSFLPILKEVCRQQQMKILNSKELCLSSRITRTKL